MYKNPNPKDSMIGKCFLFTNEIENLKVSKSFMIERDGTVEFRQEKAVGLYPKGKKTRKGKHDRLMIMALIREVLEFPEGALQADVVRRVALATGRQ